MASFSRYKLSDFRNLESLDVRPSAFFNVITGLNGSGKSSFLEGLSVLSHGKSFRTHRFRGLIKQGKPSLLLFANVSLDDGRVDLPLGIERSRGGELKIKLDGTRIATSSVLAAQIPFLVIDSSSFNLIEGGPKERRQFFDWLVFHVKHQFSDCWRQIVRCYKQRNSLLRRESLSYSELLPWDREIVRASQKIKDMREELFCSLLQEFDELILELGEKGAFLSSVDISLKSGWKNDDEFGRQLEQGFERDRRNGFSALGPHKADLITRTSGSEISQVFSRGQVKLLVTALYIAKTRVLQRLTGKRAIVAIDDLPSELDGDNQEILGKWLISLNQQVFVSAIEKKALPRSLRELPPEKLKVFHVKHGAVQESR